MHEPRQLTRTHVARLLLRRVGEVLALDPATITESSRFDEDLAADSLDLIEMLEGLERDLRAEGVTVTLPDSELTALRTVGDVVQRVYAHATGESAAP